MSKLRWVPDASGCFICRDIDQEESPPLAYIRPQSGGFAWTVGVEVPVDQGHACTAEDAVNLAADRVAAAIKLAGKEADFSQATLETAEILP
jgi:hypothetical protein